jgi:hypothetical protein
MSALATALISAFTSVAVVLVSYFLSIRSDRKKATQAAGQSGRPGGADPGRDTPETVDLQTGAYYSRVTTREHGRAASAEDIQPHRGQAKPDIYDLISNVPYTMNYLR